MIGFNFSEVDGLLQEKHGSPDLAEHIQNITKLIHAEINRRCEIYGELVKQLRQENEALRKQREYDIELACRNWRLRDERLQRENKLLREQIEEMAAQIEQYRKELGL